MHLNVDLFVLSSSPFQRACCSSLMAIFHMIDFATCVHQHDVAQHVFHTAPRIYFTVRHIYTNTALYCGRGCFSLLFELNNVTVCLHFSHFFFVSGSHVSIRMLNLQRRLPLNAKQTSHDYGMHIVGPPFPQPAFDKQTQFFFCPGVIDPPVQTLAFHCVAFVFVVRIDCLLVFVVHAVIFILPSFKHVRHCVFIACLQKSCGDAKQRFGMHRLLPPGLKHVFETLHKHFSNDCGISFLVLFQSLHNLFGTMGAVRVQNNVGGGMFESNEIGG